MSNKPTPIGGKIKIITPQSEAKRAMKISIELSASEYKGIKDYLKEVDGLNKVTIAYVSQYIRGLVEAIIHSPTEAVSDYINTHQN